MFQSGSEYMYNQTGKNFRSAPLITSSMVQSPTELPRSFETLSTYRAESENLARKSLENKKKRVTT